MAAFMYLPLLVLFFLGGFVGVTATFLYLGLSFLIAGIKADLGCEILTLQGLYKGKTHLSSVIFLPIDWVDETYFR